MGFSHVSHPDGLKTTLLSQCCVFPTASIVGRMFGARTGEGVSSLWLPRSSSWGNPRPLHDLLQHLSLLLSPETWKSLMVAASYAKDLGGQLLAALKFEDREPGVQKAVSKPSCLVSIWVLTGACWSPFISPHKAAQALHSFFFLKNVQPAFQLRAHSYAPIVFVSWGSAIC